MNDESAGRVHAHEHAPQPAAPVKPLHAGSTPLGDPPWLRIRGARTHNLRNVDLDLPRGRLIVMTGPSGSGKSSLAFDTIYAEGQRRYVESLSAYARQFLELMEKPDVDRIDGLAPAIAIEQKSASHNPRSTVGTVTEIHDYLRLLYARAGTPYCPDHPEQALSAQSVAQMVDTTLGLPPETRIVVLAPIVRDRKGAFEELFADLRTQGFVRFRVDGAIIGAEDLIPLARNERHSIDVVIDRLKVRPQARQRLAESFETALRLADGRALLLDTDNGTETVFSSRFACTLCGYSLTELEPRLFSFNNPAGACPRCDGLGVEEVFDESRVVTHPELPLASGAIRGWDARNPQAYEMLVSLARHDKVDIGLPWSALPERFRGRVLHGTGDEAIAFTYTSGPREAAGGEGKAVEGLGDSPDGREAKAGKGQRRIVRRHAFDGVIPALQRRWGESDSSTVREELARLRHARPCPDCGGSRLRREARHVRVGEGPGAMPIYAVEALTLQQALAHVDGMQLSAQRELVGRRILREIAARLGFLNDVGLDYLSLARSADTLSGGESQRIRLASQIGSGLTGVIYVLDEPSIGLHPRDNTRLISTLRRLRDLGNTVIVVEHDEETIRAADHVVDMGPGAGAGGGHVVASGTPEEVAADPASPTGAYLSGRLQIPVPAARPLPGIDWLRLRGARGNNLRGVDLEIPVGRFVCITGVSGSGKSTLVNDTLAVALARKLHGAGGEPAEHDGIEGIEHFDKIIRVDQSPIGRTPRSNPATYTGLFTPIRELFAGTPVARERGYGAGRFSFNVRGGRCETCEGDGVLKVEMHFLPDLYVTCETCRGRRYNRETLEVQYKGLNIAGVLDLTVDQACEVLGSVPAIFRRLATLREVGLGYIRLGQSATTLSGGEAQRVKLAQELSRRDTGRTLYVLDEPTTGLHFHDTALLLKVLHQLCVAGNTVVVIEHNLEVIKTADWLIDLGPGGGSAGGTVVAQGTPEQVADCAGSVTGQYLGAVLKSRG